MVQSTTVFSVYMRALNFIPEHTGCDTTPKRFKSHWQAQSLPTVTTIEICSTTMIILLKQADC